MISATQLATFESGAASAFEDETIAHCRQFSPQLSRVLGMEHLRIAIRAAVQRASHHGFTLRGTVRLFVELGFLFGSSFDSDAQYPWARIHLREPDPGTQMQRANALHAAAVTALEGIHGPDNSYTYEALRRLQSLAESPPSVRANNVFDVALSEMAYIHPQKYRYVGESSLRGLAAHAEARGLHYGLSRPNDLLLLVVLMFSFGHGCTEDHLYPWIAHTLTNHRVPDSSVRAKQLQKKALTWLRHVIANNGPAS